MVEANPAAMRTHGIALDELMTTAADAVDAGELKYANGSAVGSLGFAETPDAAALRRQRSADLEARPRWPRYR